MKRLSLNNKTNGKISIRKRSLLHWAVYIVAFWSFLIKAAWYLPGPLGFSKYLPDGILLGLLILNLRRGKHIIRRDLLAVLRIIVGYFLYTFIVYLFRYQSVAYFLWGFRNTFRLFLAFLAFISYLDESDVDTWFKVVDILFWINAALSVFQFVVLRSHGDYLGGIFGIKGSTNAYTTVFFSIVVCKSLLLSFNSGKNYFYSLLQCGVSIIIAAMAEMKFYFVIFVLIMVSCAIITRFSVKKLILILAGMLIVMLCSSLLVSWFGLNSALSLERIWQLASQTNYSSKNDVNRLTAIYTLSKVIVANPVDQFFGLGLGNCDTSSFAICNSPFFQRYGYMHYTWFVIAMVFLETGYIGLVVYISFYVVCFIYAYRKYKTRSGDILHNQLAMIMSLLSCILIIYNSALRNEAGYMMYFVLALPFIRQNPEKQTNQSSILPKKEVMGYEK